MRKYIKGKPITSLDELAEQELIYDSRIDKIYAKGWFASWQLRCVKYAVRAGVIYTVECNSDEKGEKTNENIIE